MCPGCNPSSLFSGLQRRIQGFVQHGFQQAAAVGFGGGELGFQLVAQRHQFVYFGDDAVLLGEGWEGNRKSINDWARDIFH